MTKHTHPLISFYDQDFVDIYSTAQSILTKLDAGEGAPSGSLDRLLATFSSVYCGGRLPPPSSLIPGTSPNSPTTENPVTPSKVAATLTLPLAAWAELNIYQRTGNKKRVREAFPLLKDQLLLLDKARDTFGLLPCEKNALCEGNFLNADPAACYLIADQAALALSFSSLSALSDVLNDRESAFQFKRRYFALKTRVNTLMWSQEDNFYHDLDAAGKPLPLRTAAGFLPLLAELPNIDRAESLAKALQDPLDFACDCPIPSLSRRSPLFSPEGEEFRGAAFPALNFLILKGLEKYQYYELVRELAIKHLYCVLDTFLPPTGGRGTFYDAYQSVYPAAAAKGSPNLSPRSDYLVGLGLSAITLMIENVLGISINLPRKTVDWVIPSLEVMGVENLCLKRNLISIKCCKTNNRGYEIQMESEKLYYFTINILGVKKKTLPIPSGKCSVLIDKI